MTPEVRRLLASHRLLSGAGLLRATRLPRYQDLARADQLSEEPLVVVFVSHRWEAVSHPDPDGRQLRALHGFVRLVAAGLQALVAPREERLRHVPDLSSEGALQAVEVAQRIVGLGPIDAGLSGIDGREGRRRVRQAVEAARGDPVRFGEWVAARIGIWIDYCCVPQAPRTSAEEEAFRRILSQIDDLVHATTLLALRFDGDGYGQRAWCAAEFHLASAALNVRALYLDIDGMGRGAAAAVPAPPTSTSPVALPVMVEAYEGDLEAYREAQRRWEATPAPMVDVGASIDAWSPYRSLQASGYPDATSDPNPARRALEALRILQEALVGWLVADRPRAVDLGAAVARALARVELAATDPRDLVYLGLLLGPNGKIEVFRRLFRDALERHLAGDGLRVVLHPPDDETRSLFGRLRPSSAAVWVSRLSSRFGRDRTEREVTQQLIDALRERPPVHVFGAEGPVEEIVS
jgi:hypothetical protein